MLTPTPHTADMCVALAPPTCAYKVLSAYNVLPTTPPFSETVPSNKASSDVTSSWKPAQISPCHGTLRLPQHLAGPLQELSLLPCRFLFLSVSPSGPPSSLTLLHEEPDIVSPFAVFPGCCFPACAVCPSALGRCSRWSFLCSVPLP